MGRVKGDVANLLNLLRAAAQATTVAARVGSVALVWWVGRGNPSLFLLALFTLWVLSPFVALVIADRSHRSASSRATLHCLMLIVGLGPWRSTCMWLQSRPGRRQHPCL